MNRRQFIVNVAAGVVLQTVRCSGIDQPVSATKKSATDAFRADLKGELILPTDLNYDTARRVSSFIPNGERRPRMIVRCIDPQDVVRSIAFARNNGMDIAVRSGGHDILGASVCDGMVVDLSKMKEMRFDNEGRTAHVAAGVRAYEMNVFTQQRGLATALGCSAEVGVAGLTLGGGLGWFLGKHGTAADNLVSANIVTADGRLLKASREENEDLFWAIRGGGGNFGIVTSLDFKLHPVNEVIGGVVAYRTDVGKFLRLYRDVMSGAPDELTVELSIFLAKEPLIVALICWSGTPAKGHQVLTAFESFAPTVANNLDVVTYGRLPERFSIIGQLLSQGSNPTQRSPESLSPSAHREPAATFNYWRGGSLDELSNEAIDQLVASANDSPGRCSIGLGHYMHGQACRAGGDTPLPRKSGRTTYFCSGSWADAGRGEAQIEWVTRSLTAMKPISTKGTYINYLSSNNEADVRASYGESYSRLSRIKAKYDPMNLFHGNRNIHPA